ncbi:Membrane proteinase PrsW, cleaves anti-sigma factor RsiW, M82 family [Halorubrum aquaticum]|uniref:Membrane proteinase PrsW, cleaves anti-sigma factor RsiW, M82 family n=1 Tax=Halorubrum aquaticum TaxID=387340 RepID=A0A1I3AER7_9EURY|nr:PrsW family intramembrane metalloprotease [Halorubrum aquaticum]SFH48564.1 Membrane proteinase PrsW, cleaves anti-sigma factor RsiW, M82 family [Halorubrum aquaticum]
MEDVETETDPVEAADDDQDLYGISTWEQRSLLDSVSVAVYWLAVRSGQALLVLLAVLIFVAVGGLSIVREPPLGVLTILSALPALALAGYVWYSDVTTSEPLSLLAATFILGVLTAGFAAVVNSLSQPFFTALGGIGMVLFFYLIVGPVEESVKLLAVRLYAYNDDRFAAVIDGAVYGAVAGLGFATIENAIYISGVVGEVGGLSLGLDLIGTGGDITATRALAGPGHVVYSSFAGYYLGLAKFNPENRGPIIVKGLIVAALIHATYNATVGIGSGLIQTATGLPQLSAFFVYVLLYVGGFGYLLYRKIQQYNDAHQTAHSNETDEREDPVIDAETE